MNIRMLTTEERERLAYIEGYTDAADLLGELLDAQSVVEEQEAEITDLQEMTETAEKQVSDLLAKVDDLENEILDLKEELA